MHKVLHSLPHLLLLFISVQSHTCGFSPSHSTPSILPVQSRDLQYRNLRITTIYLDLALSSTNLQSFKYNIVNGAINWYTKAIKTKRLTDSLDISSLADQSCGPLEFNFSRLASTYENTDVLIFIGAYETSNQTSALSFTCAWEKDSFQPLVGVISYFLTDFESVSYEYLYSTMVHQMAHILVFNEKYYSKFKGLVYDDVVLQAEERETTVYKVQTDGVKTRARELFSCTTLDGLELESTSLSHWEKRLMNDEFMTIDSNISDITYSPASLALFNDSGWYISDLSYSSLVPWGKDAGCPFTTSKCVINQVATNSYFSVDINNERCDYKKLNKGKTNIKLYDADLPVYYQYFPNPTKGGDMYADYCPYVAPNPDGNCRGLGAKSTLIRSQYGENIGENSRCIEGNFTKDTDSPWHATCHVVTCYENWVDIQIGDTVATCPFSGGFVGVTGYVGVVECYYSAQLCTQKPCPNACSGLGYCDKGVCYCDNGDVGGDCRKDFEDSSSSSGSGSGSGSGDGDGDLSGSIVNCGVSLLVLISLV